MAKKRDAAVTSRIMSRVRNKDSKAELALRRELHARGIRYRLHAGDVFGRPDLAIKKWRLAVFVDGDMWHGNEHRRRGLASLSELFPNNTEFWVDKIEKNMTRDRLVSRTLRREGWTVLRFWESEVRADPVTAADRVVDVLEASRGRSS